MTERLCPMLHRECGGLWCEPPTHCEREYNFLHGKGCKHGVNFSDPAGCPACWLEHRQRTGGIEHANGGPRNPKYATGVKDDKC